MGLALFTLLSALTAEAQNARSCEQWHAVVESVDGSVEMREGSARAWQQASQGAAVCTGYTIRVNEFGRAALRLPDQTLFRMSRNTTLTFAEPEDDTGSLLQLIRGIIHVISRDPRALKFSTPYANAGLEGTEFLIAVADEQTDVSVIEGEVLVTNASGEVSVPEGQRAIAGPVGAPRAQPITDPFAGARWTPYYPPILYLTLPEPDAIADATQRDDPKFYSARAARRLALGGIADAEADIEQALALSPGDSTALAISALVFLSQNDKVAASAAATDAIANDPSSAPAHIALSHVQHAAFEFSAAMTSLEHATALEPGNAIAWAWLAELRLSNQDSRGALAAAERAASLDPDLAHIQTILGFAYLERSTAERAVAAFERASELDQEHALPRLGLALALFRQGKVVEAREQAELAVLLSPLNSRVRSYMAKIYAEENRLELAGSQLRIARTLDATDPTPLYYDALTKHTQNKPIEALRSLYSAFDVNGNRPVFRSTLRVDEDLAVRSYGLGQLHTDLGFTNLALLDAWRATVQDPNDYSGHRLLTALYAASPRHEIARVNELYKSQLLQPIDITPLPAQLAESNLFILKAMGPSDLGFSEYTPLIRYNGPAFFGSGTTGGNNTQGTDVSVAGVRNRVSYSLGHFLFDTDGFRPNNDLQQSAANAIVHFRPSSQTNLMAELRSSRMEGGDLRMLFDREAYNPLLRQNEQVDSLLFGTHHALSSDSSLMANLIFLEQETNAVGPAFDLRTARSGTTIDLQHRYQGDRARIISGIRYLDHDARSSSEFRFDIPFPPFQVAVEDETQPNATHSSIYSYATFALSDNITAMLGAAADRVETDVGAADQVSPKLGILYAPNARTTIRAAVLHTLEGPLLSRYNIQPRLEPTHVVGFNQFFFGSQGEQTRRIGFAVDHKFSSDLFTGFEISDRAVDLEAIQVAPDGSTNIRAVNRQESLLRSYVYWTPTSRMSVAAEYQYEDVDGNGEALVDGFEHLKTHRLPLALNLFTTSNLHAGIKATFIDQEGNFSPFAGMPQPVFERGSDAFWVVDLSLSYRLPKRRGAVSVSLHNAFDEEFNFQDTDPENQSIMPERMLAFRFTLAY